MRWISAWIRDVGHEGAAANARAVLDRRRLELEQVAALTHRVERVDAERAAAVAAAAAAEAERVA